MLHNKDIYEIALPIRESLQDDRLMDLCINRPQEVYLHLQTGWECHKVKKITRRWIEQFVKVSKSHVRQFSNTQLSLFSTAFPSGDRLQIVLPPASRYPCVAINRPANVVFSLEDLEQQGVFVRVHRKRIIQHAKDLFDNGNITAFFKFAIQHKLNIIVSGRAKSGKTTFMKALINEIPLNERIVTIEAEAELQPEHPNSVNLFFSNELDAVAHITVTARDLLMFSNGLRPDRLILSEIGTEEACVYLTDILPGHPGSISSIEAASPREAIARLSLMRGKSRTETDLAEKQVGALINRVVDVIVHIDHLKITDIYFPQLNGK